MSNSVHDTFRQAFRSAVLHFELNPSLPISLHPPTNLEHGDLTSNIALLQFAWLKTNSRQSSWNSPRDLAEEIASYIHAELRTFTQLAETKILVAGAGFINLTLPQSLLSHKMTVLASGQPFEFIQQNQGQTAVVEYSSPNIAKPFTVGHLRSTIIGDAVANLLEATGWEVWRDNHLGDWGTQFGKQIYALLHLGEGSKSENGGLSPEQILKKNIAVIENSDQPVKVLVDLYVDFHRVAESDSSIEDEARQWFSKLEQDDKLARKLWQKCVDWSWVEFAQIYDKLGIKFDDRFNQGRGWGEAFFEDKMEVVVEELQNKLGEGGSSRFAGSYKQSEGAWLVFFPDDELPPLMIIKADGSTLYATRDLATDHHRLTTLQPTPDLIVNEVGAEQTEYFRQLFRVEEMLGWIKPGQRIHVKHGLYRFKDKKMSTRKGNVIWLEDVLTEAKKRAVELSIVDSRHSGLASLEASGDPKSQNLNQNTITCRSQPTETSRFVSIAALKWNDLKRSASLNITFDWDEILTMQGNSGPYMLYSVVRAGHVLKAVADELQITTKQLIDTLITQLGEAVDGSSHAELVSASQNPESSHILDQLSLWSDQEHHLLRLLYQYDGVVLSAAGEFAPHLLCTYLFDLAQRFNTWYAQQKIVVWQSETSRSSIADLDPVALPRLLLNAAILRVLKDGLGLLGIQTVEEM